MKITIQQITQSQEILGIHRDHLAKHPHDFLKLVKADMRLAQRYAEKFSAGHALTLISTAQKEGIHIIRGILEMRAHSAWVSLQNSILLTGLLSKLDSSVFLVNKSQQRIGVLDVELTENSIFSRIFRRSDNIFNHLIQNNDFVLSGKIISLLSPHIAMRELAKSRQGNTTLLALIIDNIPSARQATVDVLDKMKELPSRTFERAIGAFNFDILKRINKHCKILAWSFYEIAPAFMQRQFPMTAKNFVDLPPPYEKQPRFNLPLSSRCYIIPYISKLK